MIDWYTYSCHCKTKLCNRFSNWKVWVINAIQFPHANDNSLVSSKCLKNQKHHEYLLQFLEELLVFNNEIIRLCLDHLTTGTTTKCTYAFLASLHWPELWALGTTWQPLSLQPEEVLRGNHTDEFVLTSLLDGGRRWRLTHTHWLLPRHHANLGCQHHWHPKLQPGRIPSILWDLPTFAKFCPI